MGRIERHEGNLFPPLFVEVMEVAPGHGNPLYHAMREVERRSKRPANRLKSIAFDRKRTEAMLGSLGEVCDLAVFANQRCGAWYIPALSSQCPKSCYFKSSDGHYGQWSVGDSRLNLNVLDTLCSATPSVPLIVDATQHGKKFPDALSKTVPMWAATLNALCCKQSSPGIGSWSQLRELFPQWVTNNEVAAIEERLPTFAQKMAPHLAKAYREGELVMPKPIRCLWLSAAEESLIFSSSPLAWAAKWRAAIEEVALTAIPVVLFCASGDSGRGDAQDQIGGRSGWHYVPGAADDHDSWGRGLTSALFWQHAEELLDDGLDDDDVDGAIDEIVRESAAAARGGGGEQFAGAPAVSLSSHLSIVQVPPNSPPTDELMHAFGARCARFIFLYEHKSETTQAEVAAVRGGLTVGLDSLTTNFGFERSLPAIVSFFLNSLKETAVEDQRRSVVTVVGPCHLAGAAAVVLLATQSCGCSALDGSGAVKAVIKESFVLVVRALGEGCIPRSLLKQVNRFMMPRPSA